jgi:hypothetical protein
VGDPPERLRPLAWWPLVRQPKQQCGGRERRDGGRYEHRNRAAENEKERGREWAEERAQRVEESTNHVRAAQLERGVAQPWKQGRVGGPEQPKGGGGDHGERVDGDLRPVRSEHRRRDAGRTGADEARPNQHPVAREAVRERRPHRREQRGRGGTREGHEADGLGTAVAKGHHAERHREGRLRRPRRAKRQLSAQQPGVPRRRREGASRGREPLPHPTRLAEPITHRHVLRVGFGFRRSPGKPRSRPRCDQAARGVPKLGSAATMCRFAGGTEFAHPVGCVNTILLQTGADPQIPTADEFTHPTGEPFAP